VVGFAETQKQLLFESVDDGRSKKKIHLYQSSHKLFCCSAFKHWHCCFSESQSQSFAARTTVGSHRLRGLFLRLLMKKQKWR